MGGNGKFLRRIRSSLEGVADEVESKRDRVNWRRHRISSLSIRTEEQRSKSVLMVR